MSALRTKSKSKPEVGDERFLVEMIETVRVEAMARKAGWDGSDGLREFCEPDEAALYTEHATLDEAVAAARAWLATGASFYGCAIIDHQVYETWHDDRGNAVKGASWEDCGAYEVTDDGDCVKVGG